MADLASHNFSAEYSGLLSTFWVFLGVGGFCIVSHEVLTKIPRRRGRDGPIGVKVENAKVRRKGWMRWSGGRGHKQKKEESHEMKQITDGKRALEIKEDMNDPAWRAAQGKRVLGSRENWEFKYLYEGRAWNLISPSEPLPHFPLLWIYHVLRMPESTLPQRIGIDCSQHTRFLRACCWYATLHCFTTMVVLLPIHLKYALPTIKDTSMIRAGVTIDSSDNIASFLWVHVFLLWYMIITWIGAVWWVLTGGIKYRQIEIQRTVDELKERGRVAKVTLDGGPVVDEYEKPVLAIESEEKQRDCKQSGHAEAKGATGPTEESARSDESTRAESESATTNNDQKTADEKATFKTDLKPTPLPLEDPQDTSSSDMMPIYPSLDAGLKQFRTVLVSNIPPSMRDEITLRAYFETALSAPEPVSPMEPFTQDPKAFVKRHLKRNSNIMRLPKPHLPLYRPKKEIGEALTEVPEVDVDSVAGRVEEIVLVRKVQEIASLRKRREAIRKRLELAHVRLARRVITAVEKMMKEDGKNGKLIRQDSEKQAITGETLEQSEKEDRRALVEAIRPFTRQGWADTAQDPAFISKYPTVWDALHALREQGLLDPYQALTRKKLRVRQAKTPLIDLLTAQYEHLEILLEEKLAKPLDSYRAASSAFVTFRDAKTAKRVLRDLAAHPHHVLSCRTRPAPQHVDLIWPKLVRSVYRAEAVKSWGITVLVWLFTILWIFPLAGISAIASVDTAAQLIPALGKYLAAHPSVSTNLQNLVPVILVGLISLAVCPILLAIANHESHIVTGYGVHDATLARYWKYLVFNVLIVFCVGRTALQGYVLAKINATEVLTQVASSFPAAAPYFAGAIMYNTVIQCALELLRLGLPLIGYVFSVRPAVLPRQRAEPQRTVSWFFLVPNHMFTLLLITVFAIFNPLVLPFALVYFVFARIVYARNFTYSYGRRYENSGRRNGRRYLRYSLDGFVLAEFAWLAFMILAKQKIPAGFAGALIPLTVAAKLFLTRVIRARHSHISTWQSEEMYQLHQQMKRFAPQFLEPSPPPPISTSTSVVQLHPPFPRWFDVPVIEKTTPYSNQPIYHDKVENWLWLPRDPLSKLDLDDTVEFRSFLVTSQGEALLRDSGDPLLNVAEVDTAEGETTEEGNNIGTAVEDDEDIKDESWWAAVLSVFGMRRRPKVEMDRKPSETHDRMSLRILTRTSTHPVEGQTTQVSPSVRPTATRNRSRSSAHSRPGVGRSESAMSTAGEIAREIQQEEQEEQERIRAAEKKEDEMEELEQKRSMSKRSRLFHALLWQRDKGV